MWAVVFLICLPCDADWLTPISGLLEPVSPPPEYPEPLLNSGPKPPNGTWDEVPNENADRFMPFEVGKLKEVLQPPDHFDIVPVNFPFWNVTEKEEMIAEMHIWEGDERSALSVFHRPRPLASQWQYQLAQNTYRPVQAVAPPPVSAIYTWDPSDPLHEIHPAHSSVVQNNPYSPLRGWDPLDEAIDRNANPFKFFGQLPVNMSRPNRVYRKRRAFDDYTHPLLAREGIAPRPSFGSPVMHYSEGYMREENTVLPLATSPTPGFVLEPRVSAFEPGITSMVFEPNIIKARQATWPASPLWDEFEFNNPDSLKSPFREFRLRQRKNSNAISQAAAAADKDNTDQIQNVYHQQQQQQQQSPVEQAEKSEDELEQQKQQQQQKRSAESRKLLSFQPETTFSSSASSSSASSSSASSSSSSFLHRRHLLIKLSDSLSALSLVPSKPPASMSLENAFSALFAHLNIPSPLTPTLTNIPLPTTSQDVAKQPPVFDKYKQQALAVQQQLQALSQQQHQSSPLPSSSTERTLEPPPEALIQRDEELALLRSMSTPSTPSFSAAANSVLNTSLLLFTQNDTVALLAQKENNDSLSSSSSLILSPNNSIEDNNKKDNSNLFSSSSSSPPSSSPPSSSIRKAEKFDSDPGSDAVFLAQNTAKEEEEETVQIEKERIPLVNSVITPTLRNPPPFSSSKTIAATAATTLSSDVAESIELQQRHLDRLLALQVKLANTSQLSTDDTELLDVLVKESQETILTLPPTTRIASGAPEVIDGFTVPFLETLPIPRERWNTSHTTIITTTPTQASSPKNQLTALPFISSSPPPSSSLRLKNDQSLVQVSALQQISQNTEPTFHEDSFSSILSENPAASFIHEQERSGWGADELHAGEEWKRLGVTMEDEGSEQFPFTSQSSSSSSRHGYPEKSDQNAFDSSANLNNFFLDRTTNQQSQLFHSNHQSPSPTEHEKNSLSRRYQDPRPSPHQTKISPNSFQERFLETSSQDAPLPTPGFLLPLVQNVVTGLYPAEPINPNKYNLPDQATQWNLYQQQQKYLIAPYQQDQMQQLQRLQSTQALQQARDMQQAQQLKEFTDRYGPRTVTPFMMYPPPSQNNPLRVNAASPQYYQQFAIKEPANYQHPALSPVAAPPPPPSSPVIIYVTPNAPGSANTNTAAQPPPSMVIA